jgi:hypothetical protein
MFLIIRTSNSLKLSVPNSQKFLLRIGIRAWQGSTKHAPPGLLRVRNAESYTVVVIRVYRTLFRGFCEHFEKFFRGRKTAKIDQISAEIDPQMTKIPDHE